MPRKRTKKKQAEVAPGFDPAAARSQWLKGVLELCLLSIVSRGEVYGYEISQQLEAAGLGSIKGGTLYPRLAAMEANGLVEIEWRVGEHGPGRKYYRATPLGATVLAESVAEYERFGATITGLIAPGVPVNEQDSSELANGLQSSVADTSQPLTGNEQTEDERVGL